MAPLLYPQTILLTVVLAILTLVAAVATFMNFTQESLMGLIIWVAMFALLIYDTECLSAGPCGMWSWVRTVLWCIIPVFMIVVLIMAMTRNKRRIEMSSKQVFQEAERKAAAKMDAMMAKFKGGGEEEEDTTGGGGGKGKNASGGDDDGNSGDATTMEEYAHFDADEDGGDSDSEYDN